MVLEAYYEHRFSSYSHGFRPYRSCHTALKQIHHSWKGTKWFIEGDIKGCFDNIDHHVLLEILARNIKDNRFLKLIRQMLQAGYLEGWRYHSTYSGTPQGGVVSPILANIFLNELDQYVESKLMSAYNKSKRRRITPEYERINGRMNYARRKGKKELVKELERQRRQIPSGDPLDPDYRCLLAGIQEAKVHLESITRFTMPNFRPEPEYVREMKHYRILPESYRDGEPLNVYDTDRRYWESFWHQPAARSRGFAREKQ